MYLILVKVLNANTVYSSSILPCYFRLQEKKNKGKCYHIVLHRDINLYKCIVNDLTSFTVRSWTYTASFPSVKATMMLEDFLVCSFICSVACRSEYTEVQYVHTLYVNRIYNNAVMQKSQKKYYKQWSRRARLLTRFRNRQTYLDCEWNQC